MQIANSFDDRTIEKVKKSVKITLVGIFITAGPILLNSLMNFISTGENFDWRTPLVASLSAIGGLVFNTAKEWMAGQKDGILEQ